MKFVIISISILCFSHEICSQKISERRERLRKELSQYIVIDSQGFGPYDLETSPIWRKADTLLGALPLANAIDYFHDSSHTLKYYSFLRILLLNDDTAFKLLASVITDSTLVFCRFDDYWNHEKFNHLLAFEYKMFIDAKYSSGGKWSGNGSHYFGSGIYYFPKSNEKLWNKKYAKFLRLVTPYGLNPK